MTWHKSEMVTYPNTIIPSIIVTKIAQKEVFRVSNIDYMYHKHDQKPKNDSRVAALDIFFSSTRKGSRMLLPASSMSLMYFFES